MRGKIFAVLALAVILGPNANAIPIINQTDNGEFNEVVGAAPARWTAPVGRAISTGHAASGALAMLIVINPGGTEAIGTQVIDNAIDPAGLVKVVPGLTYELFFFHHLIGAGGSTSTASISWLEADGSVHHTDSQAMPFGGGYGRQSVIKTAPLDPAVVGAQISFRLTTPAGAVAGAHTLYIDDVEFGIKSPP